MMTKKRYEVYYKADGRLRIIPFEDSKEFQQICEDIEVSYGEEGKAVKMLFVRVFDDNRVIMPDIAHQYFTVHCDCGEEVLNNRKDYCSEHCASQSDEKNAVCLFRGHHDYRKSAICSICGKTKGGG